MHSPNSSPDQRTWLPGQEPGRDSARVEAFSDAVIAIIITVLSLELLQSGTAQAHKVGLLEALIGQWPFFLAYLITYLIIGQIWLTHHNMWRYIQRPDQVLLLLTLLLLFFVSIIPFTAKLLAENLQGNVEEQRLSAALYAFSVLGEALCFNLCWWWAARKGLLDPRLSPHLIRAVSRRYRLGPLLYSLAFALVFIHPLLSLSAYVLLIGLYLFPGAGDLPTTPNGDASRDE